MYDITTMNKNFAHALDITVLKVVWALLFHYLLKKQFLKGRSIDSRAWTLPDSRHHLWHSFLWTCQQNRRHCRRSRCCGSRTPSTHCRCRVSHDWFCATPQSPPSSTCTLQPWFSSSTLGPCSTRRSSLVSQSNHRACLFFWVLSRPQGDTSLWSLAVLRKGRWCGQASVSE